MERASQLPTITTSWPNYVDWRDQSRSFESIAATRPLTMTLTGEGEPDRIPARMASASLLPTLGVSPAASRPNTAAAHKPGAAGEVVPSHGLWHRRLRCG